MHFELALQWCYDETQQAMRYFLGLGSNLGNKRKNLGQGLDLLAQAGVRIIRASSVYHTQPVDRKDQPWFYNQVIEVSTPLNPYGLLGLIKKIEKTLGRKPSQMRGPRPLDIDILLAQRWVVQTQRLVIPHPRMHLRNFVLAPFKEISPETIHPLFKKTIVELWKKTTDRSAVQKLRPLKSKGELK
jgi:2-amino-4-hydroxy-6-hydroxymethyldihydropteridine diphosphokinase